MKIIKKNQKKILLVFMYYLPVITNILLMSLLIVNMQKRHIQLSSISLILVMAAIFSNFLLMILFGKKSSKKVQPITMQKNAMVWVVIWIITLTLVGSLLIWSIPKLFF